MEIKAKLNYLRIAPRKIRLVTDIIQGMEIRRAENHLKFIPKRTAQPILKLLHSATANAQHNFKIDKESLYIKKIVVNEGTPFKRWRPVSRGRAFPILKRTSHIDLVLGVKEGALIKKAETPPGVEEIKKEAVVKKPKPVIRAPKKFAKGLGLKGLTKKIFRRKSF